MDTNKKSSWSWSSAVIGAAAATATVALMNVKPRDPTFHVVSIQLTSFKVNFPLLDAELVLNVHCSNPNAAPIRYSPATMSILYDGARLGSAQVEAGSQGPRSCQVLRLPARLNGVELARHHAGKFFSDVANREMVLDAEVEIRGAARVMWWDHGFKVHVDSRITVDPIFLDVVDQENNSHLELLMT